MLMLFYGIVLGFGAKLISDGAEGMLDLFPKYGSVSVHSSDLCSSSFLSLNILD